MCGIAAYFGKKTAQPILLEGLRRLEYRGYDSAGMALLSRKGIKVKKASGKVSTAMLDQLKIRKTDCVPVLAVTISRYSSRPSKTHRPSRLTRKLLTHSLIRNTITV